MWGEFRGRVKTTKPMKCSHNDNAPNPHSVCVCVCVCVCLFMTWVWHRYYNVKAMRTPLVQKAFKSFRISFFFFISFFSHKIFSKVGFMCRVGVGWYTIVQYKKHYTYGMPPWKIETQCVFVCGPGKTEVMGTKCPLQRWQYTKSLSLWGHFF